MSRFFFWSPGSGPYRYDLHDSQGEYMFLVAQDSPAYIYHPGLISSGTGSIGSQKCLGLNVKLYVTQTLLSTPNPF